MENNSEKPTFNLPQVNQKHIAVIVMGIVCALSAWLLGEASVPIITGALGSIGGFITGDRMK